MGDFVKANTPLPAPKTDANPPQGLPSELDAADINNINSALGDLRTHASGWVNLKTYGAVCDGVTDDYPAIVAAVAALGTTSATLLVPGTTRVNTSITIPPTLPVRFEGNAIFLGAVVTYTSWSPPLIDTPANTAALIQMDHNGAGATGYGINILNRADNGAAPTAGAGAGNAITIHNYSDAAPAMQIDNTRGKAFILLKEASNSQNSAGTQGTGDFLELWGYTTGSPNTNLQIGRLTQLMVFVSNDSSRPWQFVTGAGNTGPALQVAQTNAGVCLQVNQTGAGNSINVSHNGATHGVNIVPGAAADGFFPLLVNGRTNALGLTTSQNGAGQNVASITKNGTGAGDCLILVNKGTGKGVNLSDGTNNLWWLDNVGKMNVRTGGTADTAGKAVLVAGTVTVATTAVTANSIIILSRQVGAGTVGLPQVGTITAGTSFRIDSVQPGTASTVQAADTSTIAWRIIN